MSVEQARDIFREPDQPAKWDGVWLIRQLHRIGEEMEYERVRIDRGARSAEVYYEVGYGPLYVVTLRTSWGEIYQITDQTWTSFSRDAVRSMLARGAHSE